MKPFITKIRKQGNSLIITIPYETVREYDLKEGQHYFAELRKEVTIDGKTEQRTANI